MLQAFNLASPPNITALLTHRLFSLEAIHKCLNPRIQAFASLRCHQHVLVTQKVSPSDFTYGFRCCKILLRVQEMLSSLLFFLWFFGRKIGNWLARHSDVRILEDFFQDRGTLHHLPNRWAFETLLDGNLIGKPPGFPDSQSIDTNRMIGCGSCSKPGLGPK